MRPCLLVSSLGLLAFAAPAVYAQSGAPAPAPSPQTAAAAPSPAPAEDLSKYPTADALWAHLDELKKGPATPPTSQAEAAAFINRIASTAAEFAKKYPQDPRRWEAKMVGAEVTGVLAQLTGKEPDPAAQEAVLHQVADAPDAPEEIRAEASFGLLSTHLEASEDPEKISPAVLAEIEKFVNNFPKSEHVSELQMLRVKGLKESDPAKAHALLVTLAKDPNPELAAQAQGGLNLEEALTKPLEMKFTALDGSTVDLAKLRGKVVLVDFWATWCLPCMARMPEVVATYSKLHKQGFEIVGISLDEEKDKAQETVKAKEMSWPQFFDGKGWKNEISSKYGIDTIPRMWLVNKKGMIVDAEVRDGLEEAVQKLLKE